MELFLVFGYEEFARSYYGSTYRVTPDFDLQENQLFPFVDIVFYGAFSTKEKAEKTVEKLKRSRKETCKECFKILQEKVDLPINMCLEKLTGRDGTYGPIFNIGNA